MQHLPETELTDHNMELEFGKLVVEETGKNLKDTRGNLWNLMIHAVVNQ